MLGYLRCSIYDKYDLKNPTKYSSSFIFISLSGLYFRFTKEDVLDYANETAIQLYSHNLEVKT